MTKVVTSLFLRVDHVSQYTYTFVIMTTVVTSRELRCGAGAVGKGREILDVTRDVELKNYHSIRNDGTQYLRKAKKKNTKKC